MEFYKTKIYKHDPIFDTLHIAIKLKKSSGISAYMLVSENEEEKNKCVFSVIEVEKIENYEIIFDNEIKKTLIENEKYVPYDIEENCKNCKNNCFYEVEEKNNKILKEYHEFIKKLKEGYYD